VVEGERCYVSRCSSARRPGNPAVDGDALLRVGGRLGFTLTTTCNCM
jgi:hypothetical protein